MRRAIALLVTLACVAPARAAHGQASPNAVVAEQLFREGEQLFTGGRTHEACEKFAASNKLDPAPGTLQNLAVCHEKEGRTASAWLEFTELAGLAQRAGKKDRERAARERAAALEKNLARVRVAADPKIATIEIDGAPLDAAAAGTAFPIDPGFHTFRFVDEQGRRAETKLVVPEGPGLTAITPLWPREGATSPPVVAPPSAPPARGLEVNEPRQGGNATRTIGFALLGVGALGVGVGSVFGLMANAHRHDRPNNDAAFADAAIATGAFALGLGSAALGAVLVLLAPKKSAPYVGGLF
jgi:hypothetical protein